MNPSVPFIHIRSLPFEPPLDLATAVAALSRDFASATQIDLEHVTVTWELLPPGHYAAAGQTASVQPADSHPVLVDLLAPEFNCDETVMSMLSAVAQSIARVSGVAEHNVFVNYRQARSGQVFDAGKIVRW